MEPNRRFIKVHYNLLLWLTRNGNISLHYYTFLYSLSKLSYVFEEYLVATIFNCSDRGGFLLIDSEKND